MHFWIDKRSQTCGFGRARVAASLSGGGGVGLGFGHPPRRMVAKSMVTPIHRLQQNDCNRMHMCSNNNNNNNSNYNSTVNNRVSRNRNNANAQLQEVNNQQPAGLVGRHQNVTDNVHNPNLQRNNIPPVNSQECHIPITLPHIYGGPSHAQELEQGSMGVGPISTRPNLSGIGNPSGNMNAVDVGESQLLPSHLKCGMWASLVLASVFVAGAKFYFDHQGTGLEVLIFCAFSATFFLAACTVSICRLPRDLATSPSASVDGQSRGLDGQLHENIHQNQSQVFTQSPDVLMINQETAATAAPPPPYHIAILLPENTKELHLDETPPPSYDKILI